MIKRAKRTARVEAARHASSDDSDGAEGVGPHQGPTIAGARARSAARTPMNGGENPDDSLRVSKASLNYLRRASHGGEHCVSGQTQRE